MANRVYPAWQRRHEAVLRYMLRRPWARHREVAAATNYSVWQISRITRTAEFRRRYSAHLRAASNLAALRMLIRSRKRV